MPGLTLSFLILTRKFDLARGRLCYNAFMSRSKSSHRWLQAHHNDPYVLQARKQGYRSRASYKLLELQEKYKILRPGMRVVDLGATPGGWSQVVAGFVGKHGQIIALDRLPMDPLPGVDFILGDFDEPAVQQALLDTLAGEPVDLVMSDMAPNISGNKHIDSARAGALTELALDMAIEMLKLGGTFLTKVFHGEGFDAFVKTCRAQFEQVRVRKPAASKSSSREAYVLAQGRR